MTVADAAAEAPDLGESALVYHLPLGGPDNMLAWLENAAHGDTAVYFVGHLAVARDPERRPFGAAHAARAAKVADIALRGAKEGLLQLSQNRVADGCFLYVARRTSPRRDH